MNKLHPIGIVLVIFVLTSFSSQSFAQNSGQPTSVTLKVASTFPQDGAVLKNFPAKLEVKVTRGGLPVEGARVQFWMQGGSHDAQMHNAFLTVTDSTGYARLTLLNQNTLDDGQYIWYADATQPGFRGGASQVISFVNHGTGSKGNLAGCIVSTDQRYYTVSVNGVSIVIYGNVNNYHLGEPIILKITPPGGKTVQLVTYGTYLGAFQTVYKLEPNSKIGSYTVNVYHNYAISSTGIFHVVK